MQQSPQSVVAGVEAGKGVPHVQVDKLYDVKLAAQGSVTYAVKPEKPIRSERAQPERSGGNPEKRQRRDAGQGGLVRFRVAKAGLYRVSISGGHWIDIVDGSNFIQSKDFIRARGCERPGKIVEFELPAGRELTLQLSGFNDQNVMLAITPVR